jgi:RNA-directed DNA polymerase
MRREFHVRFCEGPGVQFPRATRLVVLFEHEQDAQRVQKVLPKRFEKYGLTLHPDKTRLVVFRRPDRLRNGKGDDGEGPSGPATFDFLGFTHHWGKSLAGKWVVRQRTAKDRYRRAVRAVAQWCREHRHMSIDKQSQALGQKLRGHYGYYGRIGNGRRLWSFFARVTYLWKRWLSRRSNKARLTWQDMNRLLERHPLPRPSVARRIAANP